MTKDIEDLTVREMLDLLNDVINKENTKSSISLQLYHVYKTSCGETVVVVEDLRKKEVSSLDFLCYNVDDRDTYEYTASGHFYSDNSENRNDIVEELEV